MTAHPIRPGDYFLTRASTALGLAIRTVTRSPVNHAGIVTAVEPDGTVRTVQALSHGVVPRPLPLRVATGDAVVIVHPTITHQQRLLAAGTAELLVHRRVGYDYSDLLAAGLLQYGVSLPSIRRKVADPDRMICSQAVDWCYGQAGVHLFDDGRTPQAVTPGDLLWLHEQRGWATTWWGGTPPGTPHKEARA